MPVLLFLFGFAIGALFWETREARLEAEIENLRYALEAERAAHNKAKE